MAEGEPGAGVARARGSPRQLDLETRVGAGDTRTDIPNGALKKLQVYEPAAHSQSASCVRANWKELGPSPRAVGRAGPCAHLAVQAGSHAPRLPGGCSGNGLLIPIADYEEQEIVLCDTAQASVC